MASMIATKRDETAKDAAIRKYAKTSRNDNDPDKKMKPSEFYNSPQNLNLDDYPRIVELNNMADNTSQLQSSVKPDQPLFQAFPNVVFFEDYAPFSVHEKRLYFRNNDSVIALVFENFRDDNCPSNSIISQSYSPLRSKAYVRQLAESYRIKTSYFSVVFVASCFVAEQYR